VLSDDQSAGLLMYQKYLCVGLEQLVCPRLELFPRKTWCVVVSRSIEMSVVISSDDAGFLPCW
jgi:hypothetical protein